MATFWGAATATIVPDGADLPVTPVTLAALRSRSLGECLRRPLGMESFVEEALVVAGSIVVDEDDGDDDVGVAPPLVDGLADVPRLGDVADLGGVPAPFGEPHGDVEARALE